MALGQGDTHNDILLLLPHHQPTKRELCTPHTSDSSVQFHQIISDVLEACRQMQDVTAFLLGISQRPAQLESGYQHDEFIKCTPILVSGQSLLHVPADWGPGPAQQTHMQRNLLCC